MRAKPFPHLKQLSVASSFSVPQDGQTMVSPSTEGTEPAQEYPSANALTMRKFREQAPPCPWAEPGGHSAGG